MIFELAGDYADALANLPEGHPRRPLIRLIEEAVHRDLFFVARHRNDYPQALFQSVWNDGWWYDRPPEPLSKRGLPSTAASGPRPVGLIAWLEKWLDRKTRDTPEFRWLRSRRPPPMPLGTFSGAVVEALADEKTVFSSVAFAPDGRQLATGTATGRVTLVDLRDHGEILNLQVGTDPILGLCFSADGRHLAWSAGASVQVTEPYGDRRVRSFGGKGPLVLALSFSATADELVCIHQDYALRRWNLNSATVIAQASLGEGKVAAAAFSREGRRYVVTSYDGPLLVGDGQTGNLVATLYSFATRTTAVAISADGRRCAANGRGPDDEEIRRVTVWDVESQRVIGFYRGHRDVVNTVALTADGYKVASAGGEFFGFSWDNFVHLRVAITEHEVERLEGHSDRVHCLAFSCDGKLLASGSADGTVRLWRTSGQRTPKHRDEQSHSRKIHLLALSPAPNRLLTASRDRTLRLWDTVQGKCLSCLKGHEEQIHCMAFSADGRRVAAASFGYTEKNSVRVWDAATGDERQCVHGGASHYTCVALSPDGSLVVFGAIKGPIQAGDVDRGETWNVESAGWYHREPQWWPSCAAVAPDGQTLAFGTERREKPARRWEKPEGETAQSQEDCPVLYFFPSSRTGFPLIGLKHTARRIVFSSDGALLACAAEDGTICVWSVPSCQLIRTFQGAANWGREAAAVLYFSPEGTTLIQGIGDAVRIFDIDRHQQSESRSDPSRHREAGESGELDGPQDVGTPVYRYELVAVENRETVVRRNGGGDAVAWFPVGKEHALALGDTAWALTRDSELYLIEGVVGSG